MEEEAMGSLWQSPDVLSVRQRQVLQYMLDRLKSNGRVPTTLEITEAFGYKHKNTVIKSINVLIKKGFLRASGPTKGRVLEIVGVETAVVPADTKEGRRLVVALSAEAPYAVRTGRGEADEEPADAGELQPA
jgi:SOS-response transcriptional repressor LexA